MFDHIAATKEIPSIEEVFLKLNKPIEVFGLLFDPVLKYGEVIKYTSNFKGLRLTIREDELLIQNSLCKFYNGYNHLNFTYQELLTTKSMLEEQFDMCLDNARIRHFEFGVIIKVAKPSLIYNMLGMYKNRIPQQMTYRGTIYGVRHENTTHSLKIYNKSLEAKRSGLKVDEGLLRIEKRVKCNHLNSSPRFKNNQIQTFGDLCKRSTFQLLAEDLVQSLTKIELNDLSHYTENLSVKDLRLLGYMQNYPLRSLVKKHHVKSYEVDMKRYKEILADRTKNNHDNLIQKVIEVTEKIIIN